MATPFQPTAKTMTNTGVAPVTYGAGDRPPRGNYHQAKADFTCDQDWAAYTPEEHALYQRLFRRQAEKLPGRACAEFIEAVALLGAPEKIPRLADLSKKLKQATNWELAPVPGLIPEEAFFSLLAVRRFPVTSWLRRPDEFDYIVEPDIFHDLFGHVPLLFNPVFADYMQAYGAGGLKASRLQACKYLARLYWYTVEFGLICTNDGIRAYGAGILSSTGELDYSVMNQQPKRLSFDLRTMMRTPYRIDSFQQKYFVIDSFKQLFQATEPDFSDLYREVEALPELCE